MERPCNPSTQCINYLPTVPFDRYSIFYRLLGTYDQPSTKLAIYVQIVTNIIKVTQCISYWVRSKIPGNVTIYRKVT